MSGILRLVAGGLLALVSCYIGVLIKRHYKEREKFFKAALDYARALKSELSFKKTPIPEIADRFSRTREGEFPALLKACVSKLKSGDKDMSNISVAHLNKAEREEILDYICSTGMTSLGDQLSSAARLEDYALKKATECEKDTKRLGGMYFKLCVLLGLAVILILA